MNFFLTFATCMASLAILTRFVRFNFVKGRCSRITRRSDVCRIGEEAMREGEIVLGEAEPSPSGGREEEEAW